MVEILTNVLETPEFEMWNMTSFHHILHVVQGYYGDEAHYLGLQVVEQFYQWAQAQPVLRFGFPSIDRIRTQIDHAIHSFVQCPCVTEQENGVLTE